MAVAGTHDTNGQNFTDTCFIVAVCQTLVVECVAPFSAHGTHGLHAIDAVVALGARGGGRLGRAVDESRHLRVVVATSRQGKGLLHIV